MSIELEVLAKIREILIANSTINGYVNKRVYASHISSVEEPVYPAISLHLQSGNAFFNVPDMSTVGVQIDLWFPSNEYTVDDVLTCYKQIRDELQRKDVSDSNVTFMQCRETGMGQIMYDQDIKAYHLPAIFSVVAR